MKWNSTAKKHLAHEMEQDFYLSQELPEIVAASKQARTFYLFIYSMVSR